MTYQAPSSEVALSASQSTETAVSASPPGSPLPPIQSASVAVPKDSDSQPEGDDTRPFTPPATPPSDKDDNDPTWAVAPASQNDIMGDKADVENSQPVSVSHVSEGREELEQASPVSEEEGTDIDESPSDIEFMGVEAVMKDTPPAGRVSAAPGTAQRLPETAPASSASTQIPNGQAQQAASSTVVAPAQNENINGALPPHVDGSAAQGPSANGLLSAQNAPGKAAPSLPIPATFRMKAAPTSPFVQPTVVQPVVRHARVDHRTQLSPSPDPGALPDQPKPSPVGIDPSKEGIGLTAPPTTAPTSTPSHVERPAGPPRFPKHTAPAAFTFPVSLVQGRPGFRSDPARTSVQPSPPVMTPSHSGRPFPIPTPASEQFRPSVIHPPHHQLPLVRPPRSAPISSVVSNVPAAVPPSPSEGGHRVHAAAIDIIAASMQSTWDTFVNYQKTEIAPLRERYERLDGLRRADLAKIETLSEQLQQTKADLDSAKKNLSDARQTREQEQARWQEVASRTDRQVRVLENMVQSLQARLKQAGESEMVKAYQRQMEETNRLHSDQIASMQEGIRRNIVKMGQIEMDKQAQIKSLTEKHKREVLDLEAIMAKKAKAAEQHISRLHADLASIHASLHDVTRRNDAKVKQLDTDKERESKVLKDKHEAEMQEQASTMVTKAEDAENTIRQLRADLTAARNDTLALALAREGDAASMADLKAEIERLKASQTFAQTDAASVVDLKTHVEQLEKEKAASLENLNAQIKHLQKEKTSLQKTPANAASDAEVRRLSVVQKQLQQDLDRVTADRDELRRKSLASEQGRLEELRKLQEYLAKTKAELAERVEQHSEAEKAYVEALDEAETVHRAQYNEVKAQNEKLRDEVEVMFETRPDPDTEALKARVSTLESLKDALEEALRKEKAAKEKLWKKEEQTARKVAALEAELEKSTRLAKGLETALEKGNGDRISQQEEISRLRRCVVDLKSQTECGRSPATQGRESNTARGSSGPISRSNTSPPIVLQRTPAPAPASGSESWFSTPQPPPIVSRSQPVGQARTPNTPSNDAADRSKQDQASTKQVTSSTKRTMSPTKRTTSPTKRTSAPGRRIETPTPATCGSPSVSTSSVEMETDVNGPSRPSIAGMTTRQVMSPTKRGVLSASREPSLPRTVSPVSSIELGQTARTVAQPAPARATTAISPTKRAMDPTKTGTLPKVGGQTTPRISTPTTLGKQTTRTASQPLVSKTVITPIKRAMSPTKRRMIHVPTKRSEPTQSLFLDVSDEETQRSPKRPRLSESFAVKPKPTARVARTSLLSGVGSSPLADLDEYDEEWVKEHLYLVTYINKKVEALPVVCKACCSEKQRLVRSDPNLSVTDKKEAKREIYARKEEYVIEGVKSLVGADLAVVLAHFRAEHRILMRDLRAKRVREGKE